MCFLQWAVIIIRSFINGLTGNWETVWKMYLYCTLSQGKICSVFHITSFRSHSPSVQIKKKNLVSNEACTLVHGVTGCGGISRWSGPLWLMALCAPLSTWTRKQHKHYHNLKDLITSAHMWQTHRCRCVCAWFMTLLWNVSPHASHHWAQSEEYDNAHFVNREDCVAGVASVCL